MTKTFRYPTIMLLTSLQYANHLREYFVENSKKTIAFYVLPRKGKTKNFVEVYENGVKKISYDLYSPPNLFLWHMMLYVNYLKILYRHTSKNEKIYFISYLFTLYFMFPLVRLFRNINFVVWVADYWPMKDLSIQIYMFCVRYYHNHAKFAFYQTNRINEKMNEGKLVNSFNRKTIVPGIDPPKINFSKKIKEKTTLCFVGVLVPWQGLDVLLKVVKENPNINLKLIGTGETPVVDNIKRLINVYKIKNRVYFPNKFIYKNELKKHVKQSDIGIALYEVDSMKVTYYADPAKIKQYMEYGLPVIMTNAAEIARYVKMFNAGIIVERNSNSVNKAIEKMRNNYAFYLKNLKKMNDTFNFRKYYIDKFSFLQDNQQS
jgi:glycosyltransferase involved in cell wall biosynthesis